MFLWANLFCWTQFPEFYNYLFEGAKILLWYCLCWIFGLLHFLKQWRFCSDIHLQQALRSVFNNVTYIVKCKLHCRCLKVHSQVWYNCWQSLLKMMKNIFYFISKTLFALKIFKCLSSLFGHMYQNSLIKKATLFSW